MKLFSLFLFCLMRNLLFPSLLCLKKKYLKKNNPILKLQAILVEVKLEKKHCQEHKKGYFQTFEHQCISRKLSCQYLEITNYYQNL